MFLFNIIILASGGTPTDGSFIYCSFDISTLFRPGDPFPTETITYCSFDISTLPRP